MGVLVYLRRCLHVVASQEDVPKSCNWAKSETENGHQEKYPNHRGGALGLRDVSADMRKLWTGCLFVTDPLLAASSMLGLDDQHLDPRYPGCWNLHGVCPTL